MVDKIDKTLNRLSTKDKKKYKLILQRVKNRDLNGMNVKKMRDRQDIYRVRARHMRVLFRILPDRSIKILCFERRSDTTYKKI